MPASFCRTTQCPVTTCARNKAVSLLGPTGTLSQPAAPQQAGPGTDHSAAKAMPVLQPGMRVLQPGMP
eukprot:8700-Chlamydomonas_euryale.AAC.1